MQKRTQSKDRGIEAYWEPILPIELVELGPTISSAIRIAPVDQLQAYITSVYEVESCGPIGIFEFLLDKSAGRICMAFSYAMAGPVDGLMVSRLCSTKPLWIPITDVEKAAEALHDICRDNHWRTPG